VAKHRENQKVAKNKDKIDAVTDVTGYVTDDVTNVTLEENRIEKNRIEKKRGMDTPLKISSKKFQNPTVAEVRAYCAERKNKVNAQRFVDFYDAKGWMVGKNKMKDWKACVRTWEQRDSENIGGNHGGNVQNSSPNYARDSDKARMLDKRLQAENEKQEREKNAQENERRRVLNEQLKSLTEKMSP
jgi:hypothetical protein